MLQQLIAPYYQLCSWSTTHRVALSSAGASLPTSSSLLRRGAVALPPKYTHVCALCWSHVHYGRGQSPDSAPVLRSSLEAKQWRRPQGPLWTLLHCLCHRCAEGRFCRRWEMLWIDWRSKQLKHTCLRVGVGDLSKCKTAISNNGFLHYIPMLYRKKCPASVFFICKPFECVMHLLNKLCSRNQRSTLFLQSKGQREDEEFSKAAGQMLLKLYTKLNPSLLPFVKQLLSVQGST